MEIRGLDNQPQSYKAPAQQNNNLANNSGQGKDSPVLDIVSKRFNWGAFFLSWIWGLRNRSYITLLMFPAAILTMIPVIGFFVPLALDIWFGIKGNTWAWQNKQWRSVEHFHEVQKKWAIGGLIAFIAWIVLSVLIIFALVMPVFMTNTDSMKNSTMIKKSISTALESVVMSEALGNKCDLSSEGLAKCFAERMNVNEINGAEIQATDLTEWKFTGNNSCLGAGECYVTIDVNGVDGPNTEGKDIITIPLYAKSNGYLEIKQEDVAQYLK